MVAINQEAVKKLRKGEIVKLSELLDIKELVVYKQAKALGKNLEDVVVGSDSEAFNASGGMLMDETIAISIGTRPDENDIPGKMTPEEIYIIISHEIAHSLQLVKESKTGIFGEAEQDELDARWWEALQAAKFGWDEQDYQRYVDRLVGFAERSGTIPHHAALRERQVRPWGFYAIRRRPVHIRQYRRRK